MGPGTNSNKRQRKHSNIFEDDNSANSDLEYDDEDVTGGIVTKNGAFYTHLMEEELVHHKVF